MWDGIDKRKFPRIRYRSRISVQKEGATRTFSVRTENISVGGMCFTTEERLEVPQGVTLELELQDKVSSKINCSGTVVWVIKKEASMQASRALYDTGIEFVDMDEKSKEKIAKLVEEHLKK